MHRYILYINKEISLGEIHQRTSYLPKETTMKKINFKPLYEPT